MTNKVIIANICGLCYGSTRALEEVKKTLNKDNKVVLYKEILHNKNVMDTLETNGVIVKNNLNELNKKDFIIIRAHGEPYDTFKYLDENKIKYKDCTCPNVKSINYLVKDKEKEGYKIIIIGKYGYNGNKIHPEVYGIAGWCHDPIFIEDESEIYKIDLNFNKYFLVIQTTFSQDKAKMFIDKISKLMKLNKKLFEYKNTLCNAQKSINNSALCLAKNVDIMIVIGGKKSSNSIELFNNVSRVKKTYFIEDISEINSLHLPDNKKIGITAGASTMKEDILLVKKYIENIYK